MTSVISTPEIPLPPTQDELPCDDGIPMETQRHKLQMDLLLDTLQFWLDQREHGYIGGNMFIYFSTEQARNQDFRGPDFFAVLGVPKTERKSWVVWEEGKAPNVVIELLSESTKQEDKTRKKQVYQNQMRVPEYFWYDPFNPEDWAGFALEKSEYQPLEKDEKQRYISEQLGLALVQWQGSYKGVETVWLRWETLEGELLPTERELREQAETKAQQAETKAQQAETKAEKLANKLKELGINPDEV
ncbi:Uma2 family endonuclease [Euhalothece natronophila Z-M001]|uniref:Uma2 family endonuclease n=1 Tax=Euhalothece natronophila Z-M001 TaxID=522448 RepID=A0A5B8NLQ7_9CHRO|nr:Uma2 family endonuclease [Euhalothece natronophila]QDZ39938.1 Uma2 family endonuclease [Euhalothece natronophila Z-M001]